MNDAAAHKRTTLELTINPEYVKDWGSWEGLRELLQNAVDAHDLGHPMSVTHRVNRAGVGVLRISNEGITMARDALLLGTTTKANDERTRGQFGEGFKLAWLALLRAGARIKVTSGDETWIPRLGHSAKFGGTLIRVACKPRLSRDRLPFNDNSVVVHIEGIDADTWESVQDRLLFVKPVKDRIDVGRDSILQDPAHVGMLYARGIYVGKLPGRYRWGYDLHSIQLDRDRRLADPWDLKWRIRSVLEEAVAQHLIPADDIYRMLKTGRWDENETISSYSSLAPVLAAAFKAEHGEHAVPVRDMAQSADAEQHGLKGVVVNSNLCETLKEALPTLDRAKEERVRDVREQYGMHDLTEEERGNFNWAINTLGDEWTIGVSIQVVDFIGDQIRGTHQAGTVRVARSQLADRAALISVLVHEIAHRLGGDDGSAEHRDNISLIFAEMVVRYA